MSFPQKFSGIQFLVQRNKAFVPLRHLLFKHLSGIKCDPFLSGYDWSKLRNKSLKCPPDFCHNGGVCLPEGGVKGNPACLCKPGYTGPNCLTEISTCSEVPCLHGASCTEDPSGIRTGHHFWNAPSPRGPTPPQFCINENQCFFNKHNKDCVSCS